MNKIMDRRLWYIKNAALFSWLEEDELHRLASRSEMTVCHRNTRLFFAEEASDSIYLVKTGRIKLLRTNAEGREVILDILGPGEIFGELALTGEQTRSHSAEAIDDAMVCIIRREDFEGLLRRHPEMALRVLKLVGMRRRELEMRLEDLVFQPLAGRLALALLWQAQRHGVTEADGQIRIHLTQTELANLIGASREAVAEQLKEMKQLGLLSTSYRNIRLTNLESMKSYFARNYVGVANSIDDKRSQNGNLNQKGTR
ncbi:MAG: Crp/Fnr family transcriptional regulator [Desulfuromonadales bacterium]|nr:Crp/Fnr family transcriptional regulator [Desulfuromonadales bacterium]